MINFIDLLKRAFSLWWRVKLLWPLGMLAALVGYSDISVSSNVNFSQPSATMPNQMPPWLNDLLRSQLVQNIVSNPWPYLLGLLSLILVWAVVAALIGAIAHGALIHVANLADQDQAVSLGEGLRAGLSRVTPLFLITLIVSLPVLILVGLLLLIIGFSVATLLGSLGANSRMEAPGALIGSLLGMFFCGLAMILLIAFIQAVVRLWLRLAQRACMLDQLGPMASLERAWHLFRGNLGVSLLTWLFELLLGGLSGFLLAIPLFALTVPLVLGLVTGTNIWGGLLIALIVYVFSANVLVGGTLTAFNATLWTVAYRAFRDREQVTEPLSPL